MKWKRFATFVAELTLAKKLTVACLRNGGKKEIRQTGASTGELPEPADWLKAGGCQMVAMESAGSYRKPLCNIPETSGLSAIAVNARHESGSGTQNGRVGRRMDCGFVAIRPVAGELYP